MDGFVDDGDYFEAYSSLPLPQNLEVLMHLGTHGLIDGDALLVQLLAPAFAGVDLDHGGQMLHVIAAAERVFVQLRRRNVTIAVVWFDEAAPFVHAASAFARLARRVLRAHCLSELAAHVRSLSAPSCRDTEWKKQLKLLDPNWVLVVDPSSRALVASRWTNAYWNHVASTFATCGRALVLLPGLRFCGNDVWAWTINMPHFGLRLPTKAGPWEGLLDQPVLVEPMPSAEVAVCEALEACHCDDRARDAILEAFRLCSRIPLQARCLSDVIAPNAAVVDAICQFCDALLPFASAELVDVLDGRLIHALFAGESARNTTTKSDPLCVIPAHNMSSGGSRSRKERFLADYHYHNGRPLSTKVIVLSQKHLTLTKSSATGVRASNNAKNFRNSDLLNSRDREILKNKQNERDRKAQRRGAQRAVAGSAFVMQQLSSSMLGPTVKTFVIEPPKESKTKKKSKGALAATSLSSNSYKRASSKGGGKGKKSKGSAIKQDHAAAKEAERLAALKKQWRTRRSYYPNEPITDAIQYLHDELSSSLDITFSLDCLEELVETAGANKVEAATALIEMVRLASVHESAQERVATMAAQQGYGHLSKQLRGDQVTDMAWIEMNLRNLSERLPRESGGSDERVRDFKPDAWQRRLLDCVDEDRSVVVVAPTSAGKTFIQYYAMEKVLRQSNNGVIVYVCPTKALCNQVMAGVSARFEKTYPHASQSLVGLFTRDERRRVESCQVLVTVPQCLDILLLSPSDEMQQWARRVKWCIFDEVHSINDPQNGPIWERLLQLITCPFLALSATVGQPDAFVHWLSQARGSPVELITHTERFNDLRAFVVGPKANLVPMHPLSLTRWQQLKANGLPSMADFEARDGLLLYEKMHSIDADGVADLDPSGAFPFPCVTRHSAKQWGCRVGERLVEWSRRSDPSASKAVLRSLRIEPTDIFVSRSPEKEQHIGYDVLRELLQQGPVLCFSFYRALCESMVSYVVTQLTEAQRAASQKTNDARTAKPSKAVSRAAKKKAPRTKAELEEDQRDGIETMPVVVKEERYPTEFTFRGHRNIGRDKREKIIARVMYKIGADETHPLIQGLHRGIGCHHAGLPHAYRVAVEVLFRTGDLQLVFSTATLAQGIHAPCKSVVILRDAPFLNPTSLRQMIGRAGRRGYDDLGQCVYLGVSHARLVTLLNAPVPLMRGAFPLTASLVLRLSLLESYNAKLCDESVSQRIAQMFAQPLFGNKALALPEKNSVLRHYQEFSRILLRDLGVLNEAGEAMWLAALAAHLSWLDPSNLALLYLFDKGLIESMLTKDDNDNSTTDGDTTTRLLRFMACVLEPVSVHPRLELEWKPASSRVVGTVPHEVRNGLKAFNQDVLRLFLDYTATYEEDPVAALPLSQKVFGGAHMELARKALDYDPTTTLPSSIGLFARTSGVSHHTMGPDDIDLVVNTVRHDIYLDHGSIPLVPILEKFNCFLLDFMAMEKPNMNHIASDNKVKDAWQRSKTFSLNLRVIAIALGKLNSTRRDDTMDADVFRMMIESDKQPFYEDDDAQDKICSAFQELAGLFHSHFALTKQ